VKIGYSEARPGVAEEQHLVQLGHSILSADETDSRAKLAADSDLIILGPNDREDSYSEIFGFSGLAAGLTKGKIIVDHSDRDPMAATELASELSKLGVELVAAPLSAHYRAETGVPPITLLGGSEAAKTVVKPLLTSAVVDVGDVERAHEINLFISAMGLSAHLATLEVVAMGAKFGLGTDAMADVISKGSGRNRASMLVLPRLMSGEPVSDLSLARALRLLQIATAVGRRRGAPMMLTNLACGLLQTAVNRYSGKTTMDQAVDLIDSMAGSSLRGRPATPDVAAKGDGAGLKVGYLGVGTMGGALARRLLLSRSVMVYDIERKFVDAMVADGAMAAPDAATLARECDVIMICVPTSAIVRQAIFGPGGLAEGLSPGKIIIDQTTGNPSETRSIARDLGPLGVELVDAPVSGGTRGAVAGTIAIMCGGSQAAYAEVLPILAQISPNTVYCGEVGNGHAGKVVQNAIAACNRVLTLECAAAACKGGVTLTELIAPLNSSAGWNGGAERIIPALRTSAATTDFAIGLMAKDLRIAMDISNELGAPMLIANGARALMQTCANERGGKANLDAIADTVESMAGLVFTEHA
jgi:3-hydroxyisobutyrate dehydrogenase